MTVQYRSLMMDNARWEGFAFRPGDIVISTPPKCGTTWTQMLCALLIFDGPAFPAPLSEVSPWLDLSIRPLAEVRAISPPQPHRRFIKTHTPLDGLCGAPTSRISWSAAIRATYLSLEHHPANMDLARFLELRAPPSATTTSTASPATTH